MDQETLNIRRVPLLEELRCEVQMHRWRRKSGQIPYRHKQAMDLQGNKPWLRSNQHVDRHKLRVSLWGRPDRAAGVAAWAVGVVAAGVLQP